MKTERSMGMRTDAAMMTRQQALLAPSFLSFESFASAGQDGTAKMEQRLSVSASEL